MAKYFCPECGYEGDEPICPHCSIPAESLDASADEAGVEKYSKNDLNAVKDVKNPGLDDDLANEDLEDLDDAKDLDDNY